MKAITKKRLKAFAIDLMISSAVTAGVEYVLRKKIKNEAFHALVTPTIVMWTLEYAQLKNSGQTIGYKNQNLVLESQNEHESLRSEQILKRMAYRDYVSTFSYLKSPKRFEEGEGEVLAQDRYANTIVREIEKE
ncbi:RDD family protein [Pseudogracilibacillus sp. SE30717A]|uniref:RDD family protein n=1 Tax=Pseudogracilibacillus sp. SE30717A TaxID=3098293 RepID=UPI00300DEFA8